MIIRKVLDVSSIIRPEMPCDVGGGMGVEWEEWEEWEEEEEEGVRREGLREERMVIWAPVKSALRTLVWIESMDRPGGRDRVGVSESGMGRSGGRGGRGGRGSMAVR